MNERKPDGNALIRPLTVADAGTAARLHADHVGCSVFAMFGPEFLKEIYARLAASPGGIGFVCEIDSVPVGFIVASRDTGRLMREIAMKSWFKLSTAIAAAIIKRPGLIFRTLETPLYFAKGDSSTPSAELLFIAVLPGARNRGIARRLILKALDALRESGAGRVKVTVNAGNPAVNALLQRLGFSPGGRFSFYGCPRVRYVSENPAGTEE